MGADATGAPERLRCTLHFAVAEPEHLHELMVGDAWVSFDRIQNFGLMYTCVAAWHLCACLLLCMIAQDDTECQLQKSPRREHTFGFVLGLGVIPGGLGVRPAWPLCHARPSQGTAGVRLAMSAGLESDPACFVICL